MKTKTKALALICGFLVAAGVTAGTSTFAWFQVTRAATMHFTNFQLQNDRDSIVAEILPLYAGDVTAISGDKQTITNASQKGYDVSSGDGMHFYSPDWTETQGGEVSRVDDVTTNQVGVAYAQFAFQVKANRATGTPGNYDLHLVAGTEITCTDGSDNGGVAAKWTRVAVYTATKITPYSAEKSSKVEELTHVVTFENRNSDPDSDTKDSFIKKASPSALHDLSFVTSTFTATSVAHDLLPYSTVAVPGDVSKSSARKIGEVTGNDTSYFVVRVWLEGTENNDQDAAADDRVNINIKIASTVK